MTVIIASLFLPFQPQFEIQTSAVEAANLVESQPVKVRNAVPMVKNSGSALYQNGQGDSSLNLCRHRSSSSHSRTSVAHSDLAVNAASDVQLGSPAPNADYSQGQAGQSGQLLPEQVSKPVVANPQISSEMFMESLTAKGHSPAVASKNALSNYASASIEEFFSSGHSAAGRDFENNAGSPDSTFSMQSSPVISSVHPIHDSTSSLLKNVNRSLLYQTVLNESNSGSAVEGSSKIFRNNPGSTVITPRSRALPDMDSSASPVLKVKGALQGKSQVPAIRHMKSVPTVGTIGTSSTTTATASGASTNTVLAAPIASSNLKYSVKASEHFDSTDELEEEDAVTEVDEFDATEIGSSDRLHYVPKFGGYSNNAKLRNALFRGADNIFGSAPWSIVLSTKGNGGLKNAVSTALLEKTIDQSVTWVGTVGIPTDSIPASTLDNICKELSNNFHSRAVITDDLTFKGAYKNFCKQILWPTLHYQIPDNPNSKAFEDHSWNYYQHLNQLFADEVIKTYKDGDIIWVNDYHLMLVPGMVRQKLPDAKIGFFLHVSFPSSEVFRCFPHREKMLNGILGANSVGFQTDEYARHFMQTATRLLMTDADDHQLRLQNRIVKVNNTPIGVDVFNLNEQVDTEQVVQWRRLIRERWNDKLLIVCRDQFDRIRGLKKKMLAYERFLKDNPEYINKVVMIQICLDTTRDVELERDIMSIVDRINSLSRDISVSQPVVFLHQDLEFSQYLALNCEADLFIISSMREGMNLTCHEFVVCSKERNAPVLLSEFTGSAQILKSGALLINPWDIKTFSQQIKRGLEMSLDEKRRRWKKMFKSVISHDSDNWIVQAVNNINSSWESNLERSQVYNLSFDEISSSFKSCRRHLFILKISEPPTPRMLRVISELSNTSIVYIMNSHSRSDLERLYSRVSNVGLIAENGAYVRLNGSWFNMVENVSWKEDVIKVFEDKVERLPGSYCKIGDSLVRFHTENSEDEDRISSVIGEAMTHINTLFSDKGIHAYMHKNVVFVQEVGLALRTVQFLLNYYNSVDDISCSSHTPVHQPTSAQTSISPLLSPISPQNGAGFFHFATKRENNYPVEFMAITGSSSPVLEPLFQFVNELAKEEKIKYGYSVVHGDTSSTYAKEHVKGLNELLSILQKLSLSADTSE